MKVFVAKETTAKRKLSFAIIFAMAIAVFGFVFMGISPARSYAGGATLYENTATGEVFLTPGPGRVKVGQSVVNQLLKPNTKKTTEQINNLKATEKKLEVSLKTVKGETLPAWTKNVSLGALVYMGYGYYNNTGFSGPLQLEENPPATGNNNYDAFNVNRAYLIFLYHEDNWFLKITPNIYKTSNNSTTFGNEYFRLKYAFLQFNHIYDANGFTVNLKLGQFTTPMVAWEDGLLGYHMAERTPWGFLGVTSTQAGIGVSGKFRANGKIYLAYNAGIFNGAAFHANEDVDQKSPQVRVSLYPFGADSQLNGLGISGYYAWAQANNFYGGTGLVTTDNPSARASAILDYKTPQGLIALEYDYAINQVGGFANSTDAGSWCGVNSSSVYGCNNAGASYPFNVSADSLAIAEQHNTEHGIDAFGYYNIPNSKFGVFGLIQRYYYSTPPASALATAGFATMPYGNPYNFQRGVIGVAYRLNSHITFTVDEQNYQFLNAKDYRDYSLTTGEGKNDLYTNYGQYMGDTNAYFMQVRIAF